ARTAGQNVDAQLRGKQLGLSELAQLLRIRALAASGPVLDSEWADVYAILVQVQKRRQFATWRSEEQQRSLTLGPDFFAIAPSAPALPAWRASTRARREWERTLSA